MVVICGVRSQGIPQNERSEPTVANKHPKFPTSWDQRNSLPHGLLRDAFSTEPRSTCLFWESAAVGAARKSYFIPSWMSCHSQVGFMARVPPGSREELWGVMAESTAGGGGGGANMQWLHDQVQALERCAS